MARNCTRLSTFSAKLISLTKYSTVNHVKQNTGNCVIMHFYLNDISVSLLKTNGCCNSSHCRLLFSVQTSHLHKASLCSAQAIIGPILWGHSGPLCHALSLLLLSLMSLWTSILRFHSPGVATVARRLRYSYSWLRLILVVVSTVATPGEWQCEIRTGGVRRLTVANGPNIFQMLLVFLSAAQIYSCGGFTAKPKKYSCLTSWVKNFGLAANGGGLGSTRNVCPL